MIKSHTFDLKLGYQCNNACRFCVQGDKRTRLRDKTTREAMEILRARRQENQGLVFTGGEVTLRQDFLELVSYAKGLGYHVMVQTNGRMFSYLDFCRKAVDAGVDVFVLAVHGSKSFVHDTLTRAPGSFRQTMAGVKNLMGLGKNVITNTVVTKRNYRDLPNIARMLASLGVPQVQFAFIHINHGILNDPLRIKDIVPRKSDLEPYLKQAIDEGIKRKARVLVEAMPFCFMKGYTEYIAERFLGPTSVHDEFFIEDFNTLRVQDGKAKGPPCRSCDCNAVCEGPWKEYPQIFGWDEFKPVARMDRDTCRSTP